MTATALCVKGVCCHDGRQDGTADGGAGEGSPLELRDRPLSPSEGERPRVSGTNTHTHTHTHRKTTFSESVELLKLFDVNNGLNLTEQSPYLHRDRPQFFLLVIINYSILYYSIV